MTTHPEQTADILAALATVNAPAEITNTGGNCRAIRVPLAYGAEILLTDGDADLPGSTDDYLLLMHYTEDGEGTVLAEGPRVLSAEGIAATIAEHLA